MTQRSLSKPESGLRILMGAFDKVSDKVPDKVSGKDSEPSRGFNRVTTWRLFFLRAQGLLVTFERLVIAFEAVEDAAFGEIRDGHRVVCGDGLNVAFDGFIESAQALEGAALFD